MEGGDGVAEWSGEPLQRARTQHALCKQLLRGSLVEARASLLSFVPASHAGQQAYAHVHHLRPAPNISFLPPLPFPLSLLGTLTEMGANARMSFPKP